MRQPDKSSPTLEFRVDVVHFIAIHQINAPNKCYLLTKKKNLKIINIFFY